MDQVFCIAPIDKKSKEDLIKLDVFNFIKENPKHFKPGKELKKYKPENWKTNNLEELTNQINNISKISTNGKSISYHDLFDDGKSDNYFDGLNINREELQLIASGIYEEDLRSNKDKISVGDAIRSYKTIKQNVAQFGALSNAFMSLAINKVWNIEMPEKQKYLDMVAEFKHTLCQDGLNAKHGNNKLTCSIGKTLQDMFYRTKTNKIETYSEYKSILLSINISEEVCNFILDLFWRDPLIGINKLLDKLVPTYRITRNTSDIGLLENMINNNEKSIQFNMLED